MENATEQLQEIKIETALDDEAASVFTNFDILQRPSS